MEGRPVQRRGGTEGALSPLADERSRPYRRLRVRHGERSRLNRTTGAALALTASVLLTIPVPGSRAQDAGSDREQIQALLDARARAIIEHDESAYLDTVSQRDSAFVDRQRDYFRWSRNIPFQSYRLVAQWARYGNLARPEDAARYPDAEDVAIPVTEERYRLRSYDEEPAVEDMYFTFIKEDGVWSIASDTDLNDLTLFTTRHMWDFAPIEETRSPHFLLYSHRCGNECPPALSNDILDLAERALDRVDSFWKMPWNHNVVILAPDDSDELSRMLQSTFDVEDFVAFAYATVDLENDFDYTGDRIILNRDAFAGRDSTTTLEILAHELLHVATRDRSGPFMPIFVDEGFADYVGHAADPGALAYFDSRVASGFFSGRLPRDYEFTVGSGADIYESYQEGQSAIHYLVGRWGSSALARFYRYLGSFDVDPGTSGYRVDRAMRKVLGVSFDEFEQGWADSIR